MVEQRMSQPAEQAKSYLAPVKKSIKKRNDKKVRIVTASGRTGLHLCSIS